MGTIIHSIILGRLQYLDSELDDFIKKKEQKTKKWKNLTFSLSRSSSCRLFSFNIYFEISKKVMLIYSFVYSLFQEHFIEHLYCSTYYSRTCTYNTNRTQFSSAMNLQSSDADIALIPVLS